MTKLEQEVEGLLIDAALKILPQDSLQVRKMIIQTACVEFNSLMNKAAIEKLLPEIKKEMTRTNKNEKEKEKGTGAKV